MGETVRKLETTVYESILSTRDGIMLRVINVVGARPNFMKMAPIIEAMQKYPERFQLLLVHTGQHYDERMSKSFFVDLGMPKPDLNLEVGSGSHAEQTARIMVEFERVCLSH